jgi:hypothetical protein
LQRGEPARVAEGQSMPKSHNATGRSLTKGRFALIPEIVMHSPAYTATSLAGRALLVEIAVLYMSTNNGWLGLSVRQAAVRLRCSKDTAARAFRELVAHGLIAATRLGKFTTKTAPLATEWRITWKRCDKSNSLPTNAYLAWKPDIEIKPKKKLRGTISGTVRYDHRDSRQPNGASRYDQKDSEQGIATSNGTTTGTLLESPIGG